MRAAHLQCDYLTAPLGLGDCTPRFYWHVQGTPGSVQQTAYRIVCVSDGVIVWDSGKVPSASMTHIPYRGKPLHSRAQVTWSVTLWDEADIPGETVHSSFELALLYFSDWKAKWITAPFQPAPGRRYPVDCFRRIFELQGAVVRARLYATARGVYDVHFNGRRLEQHILAPGVTDYRRRIQYQTYDVTSCFNTAVGARQVLELRLADGWYRGSSAAYGVTAVYGTQTSVLAQLEIFYTSGVTERICTDANWAWSNDGPIRFADLQDGEIYDAAQRPSYASQAAETEPPHPAYALDQAQKLLIPSDNVPVTEHERFHPKLRIASDGTRVLDFGQNIAGYLAFTVRGQMGQRLKLTCGEVCAPDGRVDLSGIQEHRPENGWTQQTLLKKLLTGQVSGALDPTPRQEIVFFCSGREDAYKTAFAVFGFRYVQVEGDVEIDPANFTAIAVYSDLEQTGSFTCSDGKVNKLVENTRWSMKGNFLDIPTDCPTRERLGWTGDAQIFFDTGAYLMHTAPFFAKWMRDLRDAQYPNGLLPAVVPYAGVEQMYKATGASVGWADAVYLIPYRYWKRYGDRTVLYQYWPMMRRYAEYLLCNLGMRDRRQARQNPDNAYTYEKGVHLGEWLEPEAFRDKVYGAKAHHPEECTAYLYLAMRTMAEIAHEVGEYDYAEKLLDTAAGARQAYLRFAELDTDRQAKLVRPLALGLFEGDVKQAAARRLVQAVEHYDYRVGTGFLSTPFLLPVLTEAGAVETAYAMLCNTKRPGWLAEVVDGATTIWESWEGDLSQNHYSPGAVCQWLFDTVAGIRIDGENRFLIAPVPGGHLTYAEARWVSLYGEVACRWELVAGGIQYTLEIPANTTARFCPPDEPEERLGPGTHVRILKRGAI